MTPPYHALLTTINSLQYPRDLFQPKSTIYRNPETGEKLADSLTSGDFDQSHASGKNREVRQYKRNLPARGVLSVRSLGGYKSHEDNFMKR